MNRYFLSCLFTLYLLFISAAATAQYDDLLNDPKVTWIAEFEATYSFEVNEAIDDDLTMRTLLKFLRQEEWGTANSLWLTNWMMEGALSGRLRCYTDGKLQEPLSKEAVMGRLSSIDTIIMFDPETYEEKMVLVRNEANPEELRRFRTRQVLYYHQPSDRFETRLLAIAPLEDGYDDKGEQSGTSSPFWVGVDGKQPRKIHLENSDITWAMRTITRGASPAFSSLRVVKTLGEFNPLAFLIEQGRQLRHPVADGEGYDSKELLSQAEIEQRLVYTDTIVTFDPVTYEEHYRIVSRQFEPDLIRTVRLVQEWYYDRRLRRFFNRLLALAPMEDVQDDNGNFLYQAPLFYIRYR